MMKTKLTSASCALLLAAGCTTSIKTTQLTDSATLKTGVIYHVPQTELQYHISYRLTECTKKEVIVETKLSKLEFVSVRDQSTAYVLNYKDLSSASKSTDFTVELYENGTLKSVNIEASDKTGEIIAGIAGVVGKIATANIPGNFPNALRKAGIRQDLCNADINQAINIAPSLQNTLSTKKTLLDNAIKDLKSYREATGATDAGIDSRQATLDTAITAYRVAEEANSKNINLISFSEVYKRLDTHKDNVEQKLLTYSLVPPSKNIEAWINSTVNQGVRDSLIKKVIAANSIAVTITPRDQYLSEQSNFSITDVKGVVYRIPASSKVKVVLANGEVLHDKSHDLAGIGYLAMVPFENGAFEENSISVALRDNGSIEKLVYKTNSPAERIVDTLDKVADQVVEYKEAKRKKPLTDLQDQVAYYELLKQYKVLSEEPNTNLAQLELEIKLQELASKMDQLSVDELKRELERLKIEQDIKALNISTL